MDNRKAIEGLHAGIRQQDGMRGLKERALAAGPLGMKEVEREAEVNALTAHFIEEFWEQTLTRLEAGLAEGVFNEHGAFNGDEDVHYFTEAEASRKLLKSGLRSAKVLSFLAISSEEFAMQVLKEWYEARENDRGENTGEAQAYHRYRNLVFPEHTVEHIGRGAGTAMETNWGVISLIPQVYRHQFGRPMPPEEFKPLAKNALPLIYNLAGSQKYVFNNLQAHLRELAFRKNHKTKLFEFIGQDINAMSFKETRNGWQLQVDDKIISSTHIPTQAKTALRTRCPAIDAIGPSGRNVIAEFQDWVLSLTEKYYVPVLAREAKQKK